MIKLKDILEEDYKEIQRKGDALAKKTGLSVQDVGGGLPFLTIKTKFSKTTSKQFKQIQKLIGDNASITIESKKLKI